MGINDAAEQLASAQAQSVRDEARIATLEAALAASETHRKRQAADVDDLARQNAELEHDLARAESALADRLQHDAHARTTWALAQPSTSGAVWVQRADGILLTTEEATLAARAARHSAESIRAVLDVDPTRLHPDVAPYVQRLNDLADRLQRESA